MWESTKELEAFESSSACRQLIQDLRSQEKSPKSLPQLIQNLRFDESSSTSLFALQYYTGFNLDQDLHGRVTLTILRFRNDSDSLGIDTLGSVPCRAFGWFIPADCMDLLGPLAHDRKAYTWSAREERQQEQPRDALCYFFFRWNGDRGTPEREDASAHNLEAQQSWADAVAKATPPVVAWEQQRWQIKAAPGFAEYISESELEGGYYNSSFADAFGPKASSVDDLGEA